MKEDLVIKILDKLGVYWDDELVKIKHISVSNGDLIYYILNNKSLTEVATITGIGLRSWARYLPNLFPNRPSGCKWSGYFLSLIELKQCSTCEEIKPVSEFYVDNSKLSSISSGCNTCNCSKKHEYYAQNTELISDRNKQYRKNDPDKFRVKDANKKYSKMRRIPPWSETEKINDMYRNRPEGMQVDHIIPLHGELVSGLHVFSNLQYLTVKENSLKSNKIDLEKFNLENTKNDTTI